MKRYERKYFSYMHFRWIDKDVYLEQENLLITNGLLAWRYCQDLGEPKGILLTQIRPLGIELLHCMKGRNDFEQMDKLANDLGYGFSFHKWIAKLRLSYPQH
ncbi:MAG: hypothetical protein VB108_09400 [Anaerolineaceae bacterium]|nr:hypothetical protein [Anaerolineaceae bacterium]